MRTNIGGGGGSSSSSNDGVWNAVAIQDHLSRTLLKQPNRLLRQRNTRLQAINSNSRPVIYGSTESLGITGRRHAVLKDSGCEKELAAYNRKLSLAQKRGLIDRPPPPLTETEWECVKQISNGRSDGHKPCAICLEDFKDRPQVILSCSHVYHQACLNSFECFLNRRSCCPLCRRANYYSRPHQSGEVAWRERCAIAVQSYWRGYRVRKQLLHLLSLNKEQGKVEATTTLRRKVGAKALKAVSDSLVAGIDARHAAVDRFLEDLDISARECSLQLLGSLNDFAQQRGQQQQLPDDSFLDVGDVVVSSSNQPSPKCRDANTEHLESSHCWLAISGRAAKRGDEECSICCQRLDLRQSASLYLLSCSHVLHKTCLANFESFHVFEKHLCPVCRDPYSRRSWDCCVKGSPL
eukprot:GHVS01073320.1.p1 GENE.GHVS01073320.1~~GHVS01073320.1.p1  ORF type:complete len:408 (+),score=52.74 GHVS01073320.1:49-1272(+)